jgi:hypothetical protein
MGTLLVAGCSGSTKQPQVAAGSTETTSGQFPATTPNPGKQPPPPALDDPRTAVYSYLLWISYAYRVLNSDVASKTFDPFEEVRVNSYVMYNFQEGHAIDQRLLEAKLRSWESKGDTATVALQESWVYRYISTKTGKYTTPTLSASYNTTYTVVRQKADWVVHSVEATSVGAPPK